MDAPGSFSEGFRTNVFPHAIAFESIQSGTIAGKLNGVIPATTPSGCRIEYTSTPVDACSLYPPFSRFGIPQANSTFSRPRWTSPVASESTFPCCEVITLAICVFRSSRSSRIWNIASARFESDVARHAGNASAAAVTACPTSSAVAKSTSCVRSPVAGSKTGPVRPDSPEMTFPPIQWPIRSILRSSRSRELRTLGRAGHHVEGVHRMSGRRDARPGRPRSIAPPPDGRPLGPPGAPRETVPRRADV